jgi:hypothetical protein
MDPVGRIASRTFGSRAFTSGQAMSVRNTVFSIFASFQTK